MSNHIIKKISNLLFLFGLCSSMFLQISSISFEYSIKLLESSNLFKPLISCFLIKNLYFASYGSSLYIPISDCWSIRD